LILKTDSTARLLIDLPDDEIELLISSIQNTSDPDLHMIFDMTLKSLNDVSRTTETQTVFEIALLRLAQAPSIKDLHQLLQMAGAPERPKPPKSLVEKHSASLQGENSTRCNPVRKSAGSTASFFFSKPYC
jgi:DNA polymerase III gamma/tau subunit